MRKLLTPFSLGVATALLLLGISLTLTVSKVHAISDTGPNTSTDGVSDYGGANVYYTLQYNNDIKAYKLVIPVYTPAKPTDSVTVNVSYKAKGADLYFTDNSSDKISGNHPDSFDIPASSFVFDSGSGYYRAYITGCLQKQTTCSTSGLSTSDSTKVDFRLKTDDSDNLIGYSSGKNSSTSFTIRNNDRCDDDGDPGCGQYFNYALPFANTCDADDSTATIEIYDADNPSSGHDEDNTQPKAFTYDIVEKDGDGFKSVKSSVDESGTWTGTNQSKYLQFTAKKGRKYKLLLKGVYANNILQFKLPFDSINYEVPCTAGNLTQPKASASDCKEVKGYLYDKFDSDATIYYYLAANQSTSQTTYSNSDAFYKKIDVPAAMRGPATVSTPKTDTGLSNHGFKVDLTSSTPDYKGAWDSNSLALYAREAGTSTITLVDTLNVAACAKASCTSSDTTFSTDIVGQPDTFRVWYMGNSYADTPLPDDNFTIKITNANGTAQKVQVWPTGDDDPGPATTTPTNAPAYFSSTTNEIFSSRIVFTPTDSSTYTLTWSWNGYSSCSTKDQPGYAPYFNVLGGDIAAGPNFTDGNCTDTSSADIESWNTNTSDPEYTGAGSQLAALATGDIVNFMTGQGLSDGGKAASGHGISFANTDNTGGSASSYGYGGDLGSNSITCLPDYYATSSGLTGVTTFTSGNALTSLASGNYKATSSSTSAVQINASQIAAGKTVTLYVNGNAYIKGDIKYANYSITTIPRLNIYVSGNIYIDPSVDELHGVYIAQKKSGVSSSGTITTCSNGPTSGTMSYDDCSAKSLTVVGAMAAQKELHLNRTRGSLTTDSGVPAAAAETFQYSPELWLNVPTTGDLKLKSYTSLPPVL